MKLVKYLSTFSKFPLFSTLDSLYFLRKKKKPSDFHICVLLDEKYNTLDAFRPVLFWLKEKKDCYITIIFLDKKAEKDYADTYPNKFAELEHCSDAIILKREKKVSFFQKLIDKFKLKHALEYLFIEEEINTFLIAPDLLGDKRAVSLYTEFTKSLMVTTTIACFIGKPRAKEMGTHYPAPWSLDCFIVYNEIPVENFSSDHVKKIEIIRAPKLDVWWMRKQIESPNFNAWKSKIQPKHNRIITCIFAAISRREGRFTKHDKQMFRDGLELLKQDYSFVFKFHPRDNKEKRNEFVNQWVPNEVDWTESEYDLIQLASMSNVVVIAGVTDSAGDIITYGVPVISLYDNSMSRSLGDDVMYEIADGGEEYVYEHYRLVLHANNAAEFVELTINACGSDVWKDYLGRINKFLPKTKNASEEISNILMSFKE